MIPSGTAPAIHLRHRQLSSATHRAACTPVHRSPTHNQTTISMPSILHGGKAISSVVFLKCKTQLPSRACQQGTSTITMDENQVVLLRAAPLSLPPSRQCRHHHLPQTIANRFLNADRFHSSFIRHRVDGPKSPPSFSSFSLGAAPHHHPCHVASFGLAATFRLLLVIKVSSELRAGN